MLHSRRRRQGYSGNDKSDNGGQKLNRSRSRSTGVRQRVRSRALQACEPCAAAKTRCDNNKPCARCSRRNIECLREFEIQDSPSGKADHTRSQNGHDMLSGPPIADSSHEFDPSHADDHGFVFGQNLGLGNITEQDFSLVCADDDLGITFDEDFRLTSQDAEFLASFPDIFLAVDENQEQHQPGFRPHIVDHAPKLDTSKESPQGWWNMRAEILSNAVPAPKSDHISISSPNTFHSRSVLTIDLAVRDSLLALAVDACEPENLSVVVSAFPSCTGLESLARSFLSWHFEQEDTFIHIATFSVAQARTELLMAVVVGGAVRSSSPALQRLGLALHEVLGNQLRRIIGKSETSSRELQFLQAYALLNQIGLWSGSKRKMELAGGGNGNLISLLRGAGRYRRSSYSQITYSNDHGLPLEAQWRRWVETESYKRLVFHVFIHSNQESMMTFGTPPLSYFELTLPFPASREPWLARTEGAWMEAMTIFPKQTHSADLSITDCLADLSRLSILSDIYDQAISKTLLLYALAPMIQSYRHLHMAPSWSGESVSRGDDFADNIHYHWLLRPFENLRNVFELHETDMGSMSVTAILMDVLHLHLHTPVDHLELLTGKGGDKEAGAAYNLVQRWAVSRMARQSVWYAGQLLEKIRNLPPKHVTDFHCLTVYHALLCLWAYGLTKSGKVFDQASDIEAGRTQGDAGVVVVNSPESLQIKKWIIFGRGRPVLSVSHNYGSTESQRVCAISSTTDIARYGMDIIKQKYGSRTVLPLTAESICVSMRNLSSIELDHMVA